METKSDLTMLRESGTTGLKDKVVNFDYNLILLEMGDRLIG